MMSCFAATALVWLIIVLIISCLIVGTGLGYHSCVVDTRGRTIAANITKSPKGATPNPYKPSNYSFEDEQTTKKHDKRDAEYTTENEESRLQGETKTSNLVEDQLTNLKSNSIARKRKKRDHLQSTVPLDQINDETIRPSLPATTEVVIRHYEDIPRLFFKLRDLDKNMTLKVYIV